MRHLILSGPMGAGKTTLGKLLAARLGLPFADSDEEVERRAGATVSEVWAAHGELGFREREREVVSELLARESPHVVALGGGAVCNSQLRRRARERGCVATLHAPADVLLSRTSGASRPLLGRADRRARLEEILAEREAAYAECHARVDTSGLSLDDAAAAVAKAYRREDVLVALGKRSYTVGVTAHDPPRLAEALAALEPTHLVTLTDTNIVRWRGEYLARALAALEVPVTRVALPPGEGQKTLPSVEVVWNAALAGGADRRSIVLGFGGGVVTDLAGFAASTLFRGVRVVHAPTTLLGMVDAAIGGKTGIDTAAGKNLVGSFCQPSAVLCDAGHLASLPARERLSGLAEVAKVALLADAAFADLLEAEATRLAAGEVDTFVPIIRRAVTLKAGFVESDEAESGLRTLLNLGHTVGHALEALGGYARRTHGEAVALGMVAELKAAARLGLTDAHVAGRAEGLLRGLGLPTAPDPGEVASSLRFVALDKKRAGRRLAWPVLSGIGQGKVVTIETGELLKALGDG